MLKVENYIDYFFGIVAPKRVLCRGLRFKMMFVRCPDPTKKGPVLDTKQFLSASFARMCSKKVPKWTSPKMLPCRNAFFNAHNI